MRLANHIEPYGHFQSTQTLEDQGVLHSSQLRIGGVSVGVVSSRETDVDFDQSLVPFRVATDASDVEIQVVWVPEIQSPAAPILFDSGTTWRLYEHAAGLRFDFGDPITLARPYKSLLVDRCINRATLQMSTKYFAMLLTEPDPLAYPLDELLIMHRLTQERAIELHGSGIVRANGVGNLFVGHSGAGKSTTTRLWTSREDVEVLSDDRIIVRPDIPSDRAVGTPFRAAGADDGRGVPRLRNGSASRSPRFAQDDRIESRAFSGSPRFAQDDDATIGLPQQDDSTKPGPMRMYGTPWHGEAMFASPNSAPLTRIFVLEHGKGNVITRLSRSQAVGELFARSFVPFHRHEYIDSALSFLEQLADSVPCYLYSFEPDERAVDKIIHFHD